MMFEDLRVRYRTGRSYVVSGSGRNKVMGYRNGYMTKLGDLERSEWKQLVLERIRETGEEELFDQLHTWVKEHNYTRMSREEVETKALELHADRIFDNEAWVYFVPFNQRYRPKVLSRTKLVWVITDCCPEPGLVTQTHIDKSKSQADMLACPHCGRHNTYTIWEGEES